MTVTVDVVTGSLRTGTQDPYTFSHAGGASPEGVLVMVQHGNQAAALVTGVTYGGVALVNEQTNQDTLNEPGRSSIWFLGAGVPTGTQTVSATGQGASNNDIQFVCVTLDGSANLEVVSKGGIDESVADPQVTLTYSGRTCMAFCISHAGHAAPTDLTLVANTTALVDHDYGTRSMVSSRQTTAGSSDFTIGYTGIEDDIAFSAVAISEVVSGASSLVPPRRDLTMALASHEPLVWTGGGWR